MSTVLAAEMLDDCTRIREAARSCESLIAIPATAEQARRVIKVIAGSEIDELVLAIRGDHSRLRVYARSLGLEPIFVDAGSIEEIEERKCHGFVLPYVL